MATSTQSATARAVRGAVHVGTGVLHVSAKVANEVGGMVRDRTRWPGSRRHLAHVVTVAVTPEQAYAKWRDFAALPQFMNHLERVDVFDERRSHWVAHAPGGTVVEWDAEITDDVPGRALAWRSTGPTAAPNEGRVSFMPAPRDRGTEVRVLADYRPPLGAAGVVAARILGEEPDQQIREDLRRFKAVVEAGEYLRVEGQSSRRHGVQAAVTDLVGQRARQEGRV